jgi:hypothetical protein
VLLFSTAIDHPANLLTARADATDDQSLRRAATLLTNYEASADVIFTALDVETLTELRNVYASESMDKVDRWQAVTYLVADLLGLDD